MDDDVVSGSSRGDRVDVSLTDAARDAHRQVTAPSGAFFIFLSWRFSVCLVFFLPLPLLCRRHFFFLFFFLAHFIPHQTWSILVCVCVCLFFTAEKSTSTSSGRRSFVSSFFFVFFGLIFLVQKCVRCSSPWNAMERTSSRRRSDLDLDRFIRVTLEHSFSFLFSFLFWSVVCRLPFRLRFLFSFYETSRQFYYISFLDNITSESMPGTINDTTKDHWGYFEIFKPTLTIGLGSL